MRSALALLLSLFLAAPILAGDAPFSLARFSVEVTPPLGHALMGGGIAPARTIADPLYAHGVVLFGAGKPLVLVAIDWCELRNDAYERWRQALAEAVDTEGARVLVACLHQHDTPIADLTAQKLLEQHKAQGSICDLAFHERTVQRVAKAARDASKQRTPLTHVGVGQAKVVDIASNRRYVRADGTPAYNRMSATRDPAIRAYPAGDIDPWLKTISFWNGEVPVAALSCYATHPMSYYGRGDVSSDFIGLARKRRQADLPKVAQLYFSGCSGNVTAGKFNDGSVENRPVLAERLYQAMKEAWANTKRTPLQKIELRTTPLKLAARTGPGFTEADLLKRLTSEKRPFGQCLAALGLSWRQRVEQGLPITVAAVDFGAAQLVLLPAEAYVEYQLMAQQLRPESFVMTLGYGECGPGYIPIERAWRENDGNLSDWCWVAPGAEQLMRQALAKVLGK